MSIHGIEPNFIIVALGCSSILIGFPRSLWLGIATGLISVTFLPDNFGAIMTSRTILGAVLGSLRGRIIGGSLFVGPLVGVLATLIAEMAFQLFSPNRHVRFWLTQTFGESMYNLALATPLYFILRRIGVGYQQSTPFTRF